MRILVTGATGFVGRAVTARLLAAGHRVVALSRDPAAARARLPEAVEILAWRPAASGPPNLPLLPQGLEAVIHLAGESIAGGLWTVSRKRKLWESRVDGTRALVEGLSRAGAFPAVFVSASGLGYHGRQPEKGAEERAVRLDDPPGNDFLGRLAAAWEAEARKAEDLGARVVCIRLGMVLGTEGGALPPQVRAFRWGLGAVLGTGSQFWPWIEVGAAADLFVEAVRNPDLTGPVHAAAGAPLTQREFAQALAKVLQRPLLFRIPEGLLRVGMGEMADLFLHGQKVFPSPVFGTEPGLGETSLIAVLFELLGTEHKPTH